MKVMYIFDTADQHANCAKCSFRQTFYLPRALLIDIISIMCTFLWFYKQMQCSLMLLNIDIRSELSCCFLTWTSIILYVMLHPCRLSFPHMQSSDCFLVHTSDNFLQLVSEHIFVLLVVSRVLHPLPLPFPHPIHLLTALFTFNSINLFLHLQQSATM